MKANIRLAEPSDTENFTKWIRTTPNNMFDPVISTYPNLRVLAVDVNDEPAVYVPFHPVMCVDALAHKPDITPRENAKAFRAIQDTLEEYAATYGMKEIWWMCKDQSLIDFAKRYDYEVVNVPVLRKKL